MRVVLFVHGLYQHKNIAFFKSFAHRIPAELGLSTFRYDCRGLGESTGTARYAPHYDYLADLEAALGWLRGRGCEVACIFGYSAGANVAALWAGGRGTGVPKVVCASGRFAMRGVLDTITEVSEAVLA